MFLGIASSKPLEVPFHDDFVVMLGMIGVVLGVDPSYKPYSIFTSKIS